MSNGAYRLTVSGIWPFLVTILAFKRENVDIYEYLNFLVGDEILISLSGTVSIRHFDVFHFLIGLEVDIC